MLVEIDFMKKTIQTLFLLGYLTCNAQVTPDFKDLIVFIESQDQVDSLQLSYPNISIKRVTFATGDKNLNERIVSASKGEVIESPNGTFLKLLSKKTVKEFKVKYIFLDANNKETEQIKGLQSKIINDFNAGKPFGELADKYSMDPRKNGGDLGWFPEGRMVKNFEESIKNHKKDEIFTSYEPNKNWYFVVLKTHNERESGEYEYVEISNLKITYLKAKNKNDKILNLTISVFVDESNKLTQFEVRQLNCYNCKVDDVNEDLLKKAIGKCFEELSLIALEKNYKSGNLYAVPFNILIE